MQGYSVRLNRMILFLMYFLLVVDSINGYILRNNFGFIRISQIYKTVIMLLMIISVFLQVKKKNYKKLILVLFIILFPITTKLLFIKIDLQLISNITMYLKYIAIVITFLFFKLIVSDFFFLYKDRIYKIIHYNYCVILLNILLGVLGLGFNQYGGGVGTRGFFYSGNELSALYMIFTAYYLFFFCKRGKTHYTIFSLLSIVLSMLLSTKVAIFSTLILIVLTPVYMRKKGEKSFLNITPRKIILFACASFIFIYFIIVYLENSGLLDRWIYFYEREGNLFISLLSGRDDFLKSEWNRFISEYTLFEYVFGRSGIVKNIEIDFFDTLFAYGFIGLFVLMFFWAYLIVNSYKKGKHEGGYYSFMIFVMDILLLLVSFFAGHIFYSGLAGIFIGLFNGLMYYKDDRTRSDEKQSKGFIKIFLVSNMYPSMDYPAYGTFVKNFADKISEEGCIIKDKAVIDRKVNARFEKLIVYLVFYFEVIIKGLKNDYDVIYVHYITHTSIPLVILNIFINKPFIMNTHGADVITISKFATFLQKFSKILLKKSALVVVPSNYFKEVVLQKFNINKEKIYISPSSGINTKLFRKVSNVVSQENIKKNSFVIGYVSRLDQDKGWDTYLHALKLLKENNKDIQFKGLIIGNGAEENRFRKMVKELQLEQDVVYEGKKPQDELPQYYSMMDIFIFPTRRFESLGLVGIEAMACETPVIGSEIGGLKTYIKDGYNGYFFQPGDSQELYNKIILYYNLSEIEKIQMRERALNTSKDYDSDIVTNKLYKKVYAVLKNKC